MTQHPCSKRHSLTVNERYEFTDRCRSGFLWWTIARAIVQGKEVALDGKTYQWNRPLDPLLFLQRTANPKWWKDLG